MKQSSEFFQQILNAVTEHIVVIDATGEILFVNHSWNIFQGTDSAAESEKWLGTNYIYACEDAASAGDQFGEKAAAGILNVINGDEPNFYFEYASRTNGQRRWFMMHVKPFTLQNNACYVISHQNITERKLAEEAIRSLSRTDPLTNIANRRAMDEFLHEEWRRCARLKTPISMLLIDLDHFKSLNDTYGHQAGDHCLKAIGEILPTFTRRPTDICARYGGEEFAIIYGNTNNEDCQMLAEKVLEAIRNTGIENRNAPRIKTLTASIGVATLEPKNGGSEEMLIAMADKKLYVAKENGRNQFVA